MRPFFAIFGLMVTLIGCDVSFATAQNFASDHLKTARSLVQSGDTVGAMKEIEAALLLQPRSTETYCLKGTILLTKDDLQGAEKAFQKARGLDKEYAPAYLGIGDVLRRRKNRKLDALEAYKEAVRVAPMSVEGHYRMGSLYREMSMKDVAPFGFLHPFYFSKAIDALEKTLELDPKHPVANGDLGYIHEFGRNNLNKAMLYYERQLESDPNHDEALDRLGKGFFKTGKLAEGITTLNRLSRQYPQIQAKVRPVLTMVEAAFHLKNGDFEKAMVAFEGYIETLPANEQALYFDLTLVASEPEARRFNALAEDRKEDYRRQFWSKRDVEPTTSVNERLVEHYRRVLFTRTNFGERKFPWDRRGDIYIRYGDPDDRQQFLISTGEKQETNLKVDPLIGAPRTQAGRRPRAGTLSEASDQIRSSLESDVFERQTYPPTGNARVDAIREMNLQQRYNLSVEASTIGVSAYRAESWVYVSLGTELFFVDQLNNGIYDYPLITQSRDVKIAARQAQYHPAKVAEEMIGRTPDIYNHDFGGDPLRLFYDVVTYQGDGNKSAVEVAIAVPVYQLGSRVDGQGDVTTLETRVSLLDESSNHAAWAKTIFGPFERPAVVLSGKTSTEIATFQIPLSVLPGDLELAVAVKDAVTGKVGVYRQPTIISSYTAPTLLMSDIKQATSVTPTLRRRGSFLRNTYEIIPNPTHIFASNQPVHLYYELYNLKLGSDGHARFQTEISVTPKASAATNSVWRLLKGFGRMIVGSGAGSALTFTIEDAADSSMVARYTALDVSASNPGPYVVAVKVTDLSTGLSASKSTELLVTEAVDIPGRTANRGEPDDQRQSGLTSTPTEPVLTQSGTDPREPTARPNLEFDKLLEILKAPEYVVSGLDTTGAAAQDSTVTAYIARLGNDGNSDTINLTGFRSQDPYANMVHVPGGLFLMGSDSGSVDERPMHSLYVSAFFMDKYEVTNQEFKRFVDETGHAPPPHWADGGYSEGEDRLPVVGVSWYDADAYARWAGKRLPTEAEWEKAARGDDGRLYPWGDVFVENWLNVKGNGDVHEKAAPVGSFPKGVSPYGAFEMAGNVEEWTAAWFDRYPGNTARDSTYGQQYRVIRGGAWINYDRNTRVVNRSRYYPSDTSQLIGFRCAKDPDLTDAGLTTVAGYGYLLVATPGTWADLYIDGQLVGQTPQADPLRLTPGHHILKLVNPYFLDEERAIELKADEFRKERLTLTRKPLR